MKKKSKTKSFKKMDNGMSKSLQNTKKKTFEKTRYIKHNHKKSTKR